MKHKKINRTFNTWAKTRPEEGPPDDSHYSITRDRGTVKAERLLETMARQPKDPKTGERRMLVPPTKERLCRERSERLIAELDALDDDTRKAS